MYNVYTCNIRTSGYTITGRAEEGQTNPIFAPKIRHFAYH